MKILRLVGILLALSLAMSLAFAACAKPQAPIQGTATLTPEGPQITVEGKIEYWKNLNDYVFIGPRTYFIINQDRKLLEELFKTGKTITIEGRRTGGADYLFIEKIDGQPYGAK